METLIINQITKSLFKLINTSEKVSEEGQIDTIQSQARIQEAAIRMAEGQAKVAQELAIARRIETAEEVEIDEYYDYSAEGKAGLNTDGSNVNLGLSGAGKRISKRVYRFKGNALKNLVDSVEVIDAAETDTK